LIWNLPVGSIKTTGNIYMYMNIILHIHSSFLWKQCSRSNFM